MIYALLFTLGTLLSASAAAPTIADSYSRIRQQSFIQLFRCQYCPNVFMCFAPLNISPYMHNTTDKQTQALIQSNHATAQNRSIIGTVVWVSIGQHRSRLLRQDTIEFTPTDKSCVEFIRRCQANPDQNQQSKQLTTSLWERKFTFKS